MSPSEAFIAFYTLLLGLGIAALLTGLAGVLRRKQLHEIGIAGVLLCLLIVFEFLSAWAGAIRTFKNEDADIASLALPFATGACFFIAAVMMFPEPGEIETVGIRRYISDQIRTIAFFLFAANLLLILAEFPHVRAAFASDPGNILRLYVPYNAAILGCYGVVIAVRSRKIAIAAMTTLILAYTGVTVTGLF